jgi:hypothetical protein
VEPVIGKSSVKTRFIIAVLLVSVLQIASAAHLQVTEIRFKSITGYSDDRFTLKVRRNGMVEYVGINFVRVEGTRRSTISRDDFQKLVQKIEQIRFFQLQNRYNGYPLDQSMKVRGNEATAERTIVTDQPTEIVTVVADNRTKSVEDYMGAPKGLYELEQLILDITHVSQWTGDTDELRDVPYYDSFPLNRRVTFRALLEHYRTSGDPKGISDYMLVFMNNKGIDFYVETPRTIDLSKLDGYIVDATGYIKETSKMGHIFVASEIRPVRRYVKAKALKY